VAWAIGLVLAVLIVIEVLAGVYEGISTRYPGLRFAVARLLQWIWPFGKPKEGTLLFLEAYFEVIDEQGRPQPPLNPWGYPDREFLFKRVEEGYRDEANVIPLQHPTVSEIHAALRRYGKEPPYIYELTHRGKNPTLVNGVSVDKDKSVRLSDGDKIKIRPFTLVFRDGTGSPSTLSPGISEEAHTIPARLPDEEEEKVEVITLNL
jgi:hypothetical protein